MVDSGLVHTYHMAQTARTRISTPVNVDMYLTSYNIFVKRQGFPSLFANIYMMTIADIFTEQEARCPCCGWLAPRPSVLAMADALKGVMILVRERPRILSWCRCADHNTEVGGARNSYHLKGLAVDFTVRNMSPQQVRKVLKDWPGGMGAYRGFTHIDLGPHRRWTTVRR